MKRRLFNLAAGLSTVLCVLLIAAAVRSAFVIDVFYWIAEDGVPADQIFSQRGEIAWFDPPIKKVSTGYTPGWNFVSVDAAPMRHRWLFVPRFMQPLGDGMTYVQTPYLLLIALTLPLPLLWLWGWRKRRKATLVGHCQKCGYDLRATPERCPECGTVPTSIST